jgi:pilus assembly protein Flp/PilA
LGTSQHRGGMRAVQTEHSMNDNKTQILQRFWHDESGQDLIEYALIAVLIALVAISGLNGLASKIGSYYTGIGNDM